MATTPYGVTTSQGTTTFSGFVRAPIVGPLNSRQYPCAMPYHSYGMLAGLRPTPPQFYPSQEPVMADMNTNARAQYWRATGRSVEQRAVEEAAAKQSPTGIKVAYSSQRQYPVSTHMNYIAPVPESMYVNVKKSIAVGKSAYKVGLPLAAPIASKSYYPSGTRTTIRRVRSGGCVAPKKKGSIYNHSLTQPGICAWGAVPRQNY